MIWINIFLIIFYLIQESDGLKHCSGANFSSLTVCKNVNDYHPGAVPEPKPLKVKIQVRILNIVDMTCKTAMERELLSAFRQIEKPNHKTFLNSHIDISNSAANWQNIFFFFSLKKFDLVF